MFKGFELIRHLGKCWHGIVTSVRCSIEQKNDMDPEFSRYGVIEDIVQELLEMDKHPQLFKISQTLGDLE